MTTKIILILFQLVQCFPHDNNWFATWYFNCAIDLRAIGDGEVVWDFKVFQDVSKRFILMVRRTIGHQRLWEAKDLTPFDDGGRIALNRGVSEAVKELVDRIIVAEHENVLITGLFFRCM